MEQAKLKKLNLFIIIFGLITSAACMVIVYFINELGLNLMGLYVVFLIPAGALLVGAASGSGYAIASKFYNVRIQRSYLIIIACIALVTYIGAQYATYLSIINSEGTSMAEYSFIQYFVEISENTTYTIRESKNAIELGKFGYAFQALEAIGFALGALFPAFLLSKSSYCATCQSYMQPVAKGKLYSELTRENLKKQKRKEKEALLQTAVSQAMEKYNSIKEKVTDATKVTIKPLIEQYPVQKKDTGYLASTFLHLFQCPHCMASQLKVTLINLRVDNKYNNQLIEVVEKK